MMQNSPQSAHDFRRFWIGQTISNLGNSVTAFAVPLLIYKLTGSAFNLGLAVAIQTMPYLLFGLPIGAWVDRVDRKRLMIATDLARGAMLASIPLLAAFGDLSIWWVYLVGFVNASVSIAFDAAQFAAVPSLVATDDLVTANGRIQASYSAATIVGPLIAGGLLALVPIERIFAIDAVSFVLSAASLRLVHRSFNAAAGAPAARTHIRHEIAEGLRYVASHPVLRTISIMMFLVNFVTISSFARLVLLAHERLGASDRQVGAIFSAEAAGVLLVSLSAGAIGRRLRLGTVMLGSLMVGGSLIAALAFVTDYWLGLAIVAGSGALGMLFNINPGSLRQSIAPNHLLGRVISIAHVASNAGVPLGALLGGILVERVGVAAVYGMTGVTTVLLAAAFAFGPLGHAERYLPSSRSGDDVALRDPIAAS